MQMMERNEITKLAYGLTYHRYLLNRDKARNLFGELDVAEYIALHRIMRVSSGQDSVTERLYLKELAQQLDMPIYAASQMVGRLKEQGLILWSHDGKGSDGTYVEITPSGIRAMERQDEILNAYYGRVIEKFGKENAIQLLEQMEKLESAMDEVFHEKGESTDGSDAAE